MKPIDNRKPNRIYYLVPLTQQKFKKLRAKYKIIEFRSCNCTKPLHFAPGEAPGRFTKEAI